MKRMALIGCLLIFGLTQPAQQGGAWPPDPAILFTDAVKVVKTELAEQPGPPFEPDEGSRSVLASSGRVYPWPENLENVLLYFGKVVVVDNGLFINVNEKGKSDWSIWRLDLKTGSYSAYGRDTIESRCGAIRLYELDREWVFYTDPASKQVRLCNMKTGPMGAPLPAEYEWEVTSLYRQKSLAIENSPDRSRLAFFGQKPFSYDTAVFSFEIRTGRLIKLGSFARESELYMERWVDNSTILIRSARGDEWSDKSVYIADVSKPNNLQLAQRSPRFYPKYLDNPARLESFVGPNSVGHPFTDCFLQVFDIRTRMAKQYYYGRLCEPEYGPAIGTGYYRDVSDDTRSPATLVRYNSITRQRKDLYKGEIEYILWVSADERYLALVLDDNGKIDRPPFWLWQMHKDLSHPRPVIVELATGKVLFEAALGRPPDNWAWLNSVEQITPGVLLLTYWQFAETVKDRTYDDFDNDYPHRHSVLRKVDGKFTETILEGYASKLRAGDTRLLLWKDGQEKSTGLSLYDIGTGKYTELVHLLKAYTLHLEKYEQGLLTVSVTPAGETAASARRLARYTLRLPSS